MLPYLFDFSLPPTLPPPPPLPFPFTLLYLLLIGKFQALKSSCYRALVVIRGGGVDGANKAPQRPTPENKAQTPTQPSSSSSFLQRLGPTHGSLEKGRVGESALKTTPGRLQNHFINNLHYESPNKVLYTCLLSFLSFFSFFSFLLLLCTLHFYFFLSHMQIGRSII